MADKYINIQYPFRDSLKGFFLELTETDRGAIKSNLMHLILTQKGTRYYMPKFGTNLRKFIFEPNDGFTENGIRSEITEAVTTFMPNLRINNVLIDRESEGDYIATVQIDYTITEDTFKTNDLVTIKL